MKKIDFEAHFVTRDWVSQMFKNKGYPRYAKEKTTQTFAPIVASGSRCVKTHPTRRLISRGRQFRRLAVDRHVVDR